MQSGIVPVAMPSSSGALGPAGDCVYMGYTVKETSGSAVAVFRLRDGGVVGGTILATVSVPSGTSAQFTVEEGVKARGGMYFEKVSGAYEGSVFYG